MRTAQGRALFGGVAAHPFRPLHYPMTSAIGLGILTAGHRHGWPVAEGGSASITTALAAMLTDLGGKIETGVPIQAADRRLTAGRRHPVSTWPRNRSQPSSPTGCLPANPACLRRFPPRARCFKVDFAVGGVPWTNPHARRAGTVHHVAAAR